RPREDADIDDVYDVCPRDLRYGRILSALSPKSKEALMASTLTAQRHKVDESADSIEYCFEKGWSDGLPVVPPTEARVRKMLEAARLEPDRQIAFIDNR